MKISKVNLENACNRIGLDHDTSDNLWSELKKENSSKFNFENLAYYFGAFIVMAAMGWFMTEAWDDIGGLGISALGAGYFGVFLLVGRRLWTRNEMKIPGGLLLTTAVWMIPLIVFGIEKQAGLWPGDGQESFQDYHVWIQNSWIIMEICTIITGFIFLR
ncbi:MAG: DUF2157 domain-containing protein, partial [Bacteroidetes bacterium]|nr:DUF2157 domain-containing protein [Bacteroidota bacterium]